MRRDALGLVLAVALAGCGGGGTEASSPSSTTSPPPSANPTSSPSPTPSPAYTPPSPPPPPPPLVVPALGTAQTGPYGAVTVYAVRNPVTPTDPTAARIATAGTQFAVADIKICATGSANYSALDWQLKDAEDRAYTFFNTQIGAKDPNLSKADTVAAGGCSRGWLTFEVPKGTAVKEIDYAHGGQALTWAVA